jgi:radical SAM protein with 4Fe4S-binding SPASM domain
MAESTDQNRSTSSITASLDYHHPLEDWLGRDWIRWILRKISAPRPGRARSHLEGALMSYGDHHGCLHERVAYWPIHKIIDLMRGDTPRENIWAKLGGHPPTVRGIVATARSVAEFGLTTPQRWLMPLFVVWNFTDRCNLSCRHCYQSSSSKTAEGELTLKEKLALIDDFGRHYVAMVAFAGGEPTLSPDLEPVLERCQQYGIHTTIATHGGLLSKERCRRLADRGLRYVEVSLDSVDPEKHDRFRGRSGMWRESVQGIKNVVATPGLRAGLAMCVTRANLDEVEKMLQFAVDLGVSCFAHFNFIPTGRGRRMADQDISPQQREKLLLVLHDWMQSQKIGVISTAPQFGRICLQHAGAEALISCSHAGNGPGARARVVAKYLGGCGAGRTYACLQPNGDVTPCVYMPDRIMGNVREKNFQDIFRGSPWWDLLCNRREREGNCAACDHRCFCGGCRARADAYLNRLDHSDPGCMNNVSLWQQLTAAAALSETVQTNNSHALYRHLKSPGL